MPKTNAQTAVRTRAAKPAKAAAKVNNDAIVQSSGTQGGATHVVRSVGGETFTFPTEQWSGDIRKACAIGASYKAAFAAVKALPAPKAKAQLARGVQANQAQHSAKAVSDQNRKGKASNKADAVTQKPSSKSTRGVVSTRNGDQKITVVAKESPYKPGSKADVTFALFAKAGTVAGFKALVAKHPDRYDAGYIRYSARDGYIKVG